MLANNQRDTYGDALPNRTVSTKKKTATKKLCDVTIAVTSVEKQQRCEPPPCDSKRLTQPIGLSSTVVNLTQFCAAGSSCVFSASNPLQRSRLLLQLFTLNSWLAGGVGVARQTFSTTCTLRANCGQRACDRYQLTVDGYTLKYCRGMFTQQSALYFRYALSTIVYCPR